jgi:hypothetical protein
VTDPKTRIDKLADQLAADGRLTSLRWRPVLQAVPRHHFAPARAFAVPGSEVGPAERVIDLDNDPAGWWDAVYSDMAIITQRDDGAGDPACAEGMPTCSLSAPGVVVSFLQLLDPAGCRAQVPRTCCHDGQAQAGGLVQQAEGEGVADAVRPYVDRVEAGRRNHQGVSGRQHVRFIGLLVLAPHWIAGHVCQAGGVQELHPVRGCDYAHVPAHLLGELHEVGKGSRSIPPHATIYRTGRSLRQPQDHRCSSVCDSHPCRHAAQFTTTCGRGGASDRSQTNTEC